MPALPTARTVGEKVALDDYADRVCTMGPAEAERLADALYDRAREARVNRQQALHVNAAANLARALAPFDEATR